MPGVLTSAIAPVADLLQTPPYEREGLLELALPKLGRRLATESFPNRAQVHTGVGEVAPIFLADLVDLAQEKLERFGSWSGGSDRIAGPQRTSTLGRSHRAGSSDIRPHLLERRLDLCDRMVEADQPNLQLTEAGAGFGARTR